MVPLRFIVTPMGWAWSVFFVQLGQTNWLSPVLPPASWMSNYVPMASFAENPGDRTVTKSLYIDNYAAFGTSTNRVQAAAAEMHKALASEGILSTLDPPGMSTHLGFELRNNRWSPMKPKFWRLERAAYHLAFDLSLIHI